MDEHQALDFGSGTGGFIPALGIQFLGAREGSGSTRLEVQELHLSPIGKVHGGVISSLIDTTMGYALLPLLDPGQICVTLELKVNYVSNVSGGVLNCEARVINRGHRVALVEAHVEAAGGTLIAAATATFYITKLSPQR